MSVEDFLDWARARDDEKWELRDGTPVLKSSPRVPETMERHAHLRAKFRAAMAFDRGIAEKDLPCEALPDGAAVRTPEGSLYLPDALIRCGAASPGGEAVVTPDPVVVLEVLSPSDTDDEMTEKTRAYFTIPTVAHVLIVDTGRRRLRHYARGEGDALILRFLDETAGLALAPPGLSLTVSDVLPLP